MNLENYALGLLSRQDYTQKKMREALLKKTGSDDEVDQAMEFLVSHDLINDNRYAGIYIESQKGKYGRKRLEFFLRQKGIEQSIIDGALAELDDAEEFASACRILCKKRMSVECGDAQREKRKLVDFLVRKGFRYDVAREAVREILRGDHRDLGEKADCHRE